MLNLNINTVLTPSSATGIASGGGGGEGFLLQTEGDVAGHEISTEGDVAGTVLQTE